MQACEHLGKDFETAFKEGVALYIHGKLQRVHLVCTAVKGTSPSCRKLAIWIAISGARPSAATLPCLVPEFAICAARGLTTTPSLTSQTVLASNGPCCHWPQWLPGTRRLPSLYCCRPTAQGQLSFTNRIYGITGIWAMADTSSPVP